VATVCVQHFGSEVVWRATDSLLFLPRVEHLSSESEITDFELHPVCQKQIAEFEVPVDDFLSVDVLTGLDKLIDVVAGFDLMKTLTATHKIRQGLIVTDVKQDVDVLLVFEVSIEPHDVFVVQRPVDLDLAC
jgi:hypothetical protein